jgi:hypothetical protein
MMGYLWANQARLAFTAVGSVLRAETTIHDGGEFRVYRRKEGESRPLPAAGRPPSGRDDNCVLRRRPRYRLNM